MGTVNSIQKCDKLGSRVDNIVRSTGRDVCPVLTLEAFRDSQTLNSVGEAVMKRGLWLRFRAA